jgi:hypothetical protein
VRLVSAGEQGRQSLEDHWEEEYTVPNVFETKTRTEQLGFQPPGSSKGGCSESVSRPRNNVAKVSTLYPQYRKVYVVRRGYVPGIYYKWSDSELQVKGFSGARYKISDQL